VQLEHHYAGGAIQTPQRDQALYRFRALKKGQEMIRSFSSRAGTHRRRRRTAANLKGYKRLVQDIEAAANADATRSSTIEILGIQAMDSQVSRRKISLKSPCRVLPSIPAEAGIRVLKFSGFPLKPCGNDGNCVRISFGQLRVCIGVRRGFDILNEPFVTLKDSRRFASDAGACRHAMKRANHSWPFLESTKR